jgi:hypothetical protein
MSRLSGNSHRRANSAEAAVHEETQIGRTKALLKDEGVLGEEWKASKSWVTQQRRRPSAPELRIPIGSPQERSGKAVDQRTARTEGTMFYTGIEMLPIIHREFGEMRSSLCGFQYNLDHTECISQIVVKIAGRSVHGRFILEKKNFYNSSCTRQPARVDDLYQAGCKLRMSKPLWGGFSCMHVKCLIIDQKTVLSGSVNLTHNGLENNKEHLYLMTEPSLAAAVFADFEREWPIAEPNCRPGDLADARKALEASKREAFE